MTIDIGPNLMWFLKAVLGIYVGWVVAQPIVAAIQAKATIQVARIKAEAGCSTTE
jgi:hypothetical protein